MSCNHFSADRKRLIGNNSVANVLDFKKVMSSSVHISSVALFTHVLAKKLKMSIEPYTINFFSGGLWPAWNMWDSRRGDREGTIKLNVACILVIEDFALPQYPTPIFEWSENLVLLQLYLYSILWATSCSLLWVQRDDSYNYKLWTLWQVDKKSVLLQLP